MEGDAIERARLKLQELRNSAVQSNARGFVRMFQQELAELRMLGMPWNKIAAELAAAGFPYSDGALRLAFRPFRGARAAQARTGVLVKEQVIERYRDVPPLPKPGQQPHPMTGDRAEGAPEARAVIGKEEAGRTTPAITAEPDTAPSSAPESMRDASEGSAEALLVSEIATCESGEVDRTIEVRDGRVYYENGEAVTRVLPIRVVRVLRATGRYVPRSSGRSENLVKMEH